MHPKKRLVQRSVYQKDAFLKKKKNEGQECHVDARAPERLSASSRSTGPPADPDGHEWRREGRPLGRRWRRGDAVAEEGVVEDGGDAVDGDGGGGVEVWMCDGCGVEGEVGGGVVGDGDGLAGEEGGEAGVAVEEEEVGECEALWDHVIWEEERVHHSGKVVVAVECGVLWDEECGADWKHCWV